MTESKITIAEHLLAWLLGLAERRAVSHRKSAERYSQRARELESFADFQKFWLNRP